MQFQKDIFISYAHIDDESLTEHQKGWITDFQRALDIRLAQLLGRKAVIWRDPSLQGNHVFDRQITDQFAQVAVMISILSPRYVRSEWCIRELDEFYQTCQQNIGYDLQNKVRIFKVIKTPVPVDMHPSKIRNILGYEFYGTDASTGRTREYTQAFGQQSEWMYWEKMNDLVHDISSFLQQIEEEGSSLTLASTSAPIAAIAGPAPAQSPGGAQNKTGKKIYLAESGYDMQTFRESIRRELQDAGYQIFPDRQLPLLASHLLEDVNYFMQDASFAIHLIGENYGIVPEGTNQSIIELQNEVGSTYSASGKLPRLIWIPEGVAPTDERQLNFIDKLSKSRTETLGADLIIGSLEDLKMAAVDTMKALDAKDLKKVPELAAAAGTKMIYLICDVSDLTAVQPLEDFLFANGFEVVTPLFEGDEPQLREDHLENLRACDAAIIFFGQANELWLRAKMRDFLKISGYGRTQPLTAKAVYLSGPINAAKERFRTLEAEVINGTTHLPEQQLINLLSK